MTKLVLAFFGSCLFMQLTLAQYPGAGDYICSKIINYNEFTFR